MSSGICTKNIQKLSLQYKLCYNKLNRIMFCPSDGETSLGRYDKIMKGTLAMDNIVPENFAQCAFSFDASELSVPQPQPDNAAQLKKCSSCKQIKPLEDFSPGYISSHGLASRCKTCKSSFDLQRYHKSRAEYILDIETNVKKCYVCKEAKSANDYSLDKSAKDGYQRKCRDCQATYRQEHYVPRPRKKVEPVIPSSKTCRVCHKLRPIEDFSPAKETKDRHHPECKECGSAIARQRPRTTTEQNKRNALRSIHRITHEHYDAKLEAQGGVCAICEKSETVIDKRIDKVRRLAVDHNHETGEIRDLLCSRCNQTFGRMEGDPELIKSFLRYAEKWRGGDD